MEPWVKAKMDAALARQAKEAAENKALARRVMVMPTGTPAQVRAALRDRLHALTGVKRGK